MKRRKLKRSVDRRVFSRTSGQHVKNTVQYTMRGGKRL